MKLVLDAIPLIYSAKTRVHSLFSRLNVELFTTDTVKAEVLKGDFEEKGVLERLFAGEVKVLKAKGVFPSARGLHSGEASALALAKEKNAVLVSDDRVARTVAKAMGVQVVYSNFFIFRALEKKVVDAGEAKALVEELVESGWWCDAETLARIFNAIEKYV